MLKKKTTYVVGGSKHCITIPSLVFHDSKFPFKKGEKLEIEIVDDMLTIKKMKQN